MRGTPQNSNLRDTKSRPPPLLSVGPPLNLSFFRAALSKIAGKESLTAVQGEEEYFLNPNLIKIINMIIRSQLIDLPVC